MLACHHDKGPLGLIRETAVQCDLVAARDQLAWNDLRDPISISRVGHLGCIAGELQCCTCAGKSLANLGDVGQQLRRNAEATREVGQVQLRDADELGTGGPADHIGAKAKVDKLGELLVARRDACIDQPHKPSRHGHPCGSAFGNVLDPRLERRLKHGHLLEWEPLNEFGN
ncbi:MAG: hypothetical protein E8D40_12030 [Nitrospira sp.]|nr:MAG: hypothetical protein E8D40_12030 [Nitrospira sp.]